MSLIDPHDLTALMGALTDRIREMHQEQCVGRSARGEIIAENHALRDQLGRTDATLMALCQLLGLDPTGDVVAQVEAREQARQRQLLDAVRAGVTTPGNALILVDRHHERALFLGDGFDAAWLRFRADLRTVDGMRHLSADVVATLEPSHPVRRWIEAVPCVPIVERYSRELCDVPPGYTAHTLSDPDATWVLWT